MARKRITAYEAKTHLGQLLRDAEAGASFLIVRRGKPVARLDPPGEEKEPDFKKAAAAFAALRKDIRARSRSRGRITAKDLINDGRRL